MVIQACGSSDCTDIIMFYAMLSGLKLYEQQGLNTCLNNWLIDVNMVNVAASVYCGVTGLIRGTKANVSESQNITPPMLYNMCLNLENACCSLCDSHFAVGCINRHTVWITPIISQPSRIAWKYSINPTFHSIHDSASLTKLQKMLVVLSVIATLQPHGVYQQQYGRNAHEMVI